MQRRVYAILLVFLTFLYTMPAQAADHPTAEDLFAQYPDPGFVLTLAPQDDPLLVLVNRDHLLPKSFKPKVIAPRVAKKRGADIEMQAMAALALEEMFLAAGTEGLELVAVSGYRSYSKQKTLYGRSVERNGPEKADLMSARPGASEHQLGLAMDISCASLNHELISKLMRKAEGKWIAKHCAEYGFIIRYKEEWTATTGYQGEPWHIRYVGVQHAQWIMAANVPFETYRAYLDAVWQRQQGLTP